MDREDPNPLLLPNTLPQSHDSEVQLACGRGMGEIRRSLPSPGMLLSSFNLQKRSPAGANGKESTMLWLQLPDKSTDGSTPKSTTMECILLSNVFLTWFFPPVSCFDSSIYLLI